MEHVWMDEVSVSASDDESLKSSDEEYKSEYESFLYTADGLIAESGAQIDTMNKGLEEKVKDIDIVIDRRLVFDSFESKRMSPLEETLKSLAEGVDKLNQRELERLEREVERGKEDILNKERSTRNKMYRNIGLALFGLASITATALYFLIKWLNSDKRTSDVFTPDDAAKAEKMLKEWNELNDTEFWARIAEYVEKSNPSFELQMQMMGYIKYFASDKNAPRFEWTRTQKLDAVDQLAKAFFNCPEKKGKKSAAIYKALVGIKPDNRQLPRSLAADITEMAIAQIVAHGRAQRGAA